MGTTSQTYIGITIGPIYETVMLTSKPGGLWVASYLFSYISKQICRALIFQKEIETNCFVTPDVKGLKEHEELSDGVGLYHDRIIFQVNCDVNQSERLMQEVIEFVLQDVAQKIALSLEKNSDDKDIWKFVQNYFQIYYGVFDISKDKNPIIAISPYLDAIEYEKKILKEENYLLQLFGRKNKKNGNDSESREKKSNEYIKRLIKELNISLESFQLTKGNEQQLKEIDYIANGLDGEKRLKVVDYFAIVKMDGDNMGKLLTSFGNDKEKTLNFSHKCHDFAERASKKINAYGSQRGMTIYAGGDDLLFLAPILTKESNIFLLVEEIKTIFNGIFQEEISDETLSDKPSLSAGILISYRKYPLYEAFRQVHILLDKAKGCNKEKDAIAIHVQKHSGKIFSMVASGTSRKNTTYQRFLELIPKGEGELDSEFLQSVHYKIQSFYSLFDLGQTTSQLEIKQKIINNIFWNIFDHEVHQTENTQKYIQRVKELLLSLSGGATNETTDETVRNFQVLKDGENIHNPLEIVGNILSTMKLYYEEGLEERGN